MTDFGEPEACKDLKEEHDKCFHAWLARFIKGEVKTDECQEVWERYRACTAEKLKHHGLSHLQDEWKKPNWEDLDIKRNK
jgi:TRIAP1/MDM35 family protein